MSEDKEQIIDLLKSIRDVTFFISIYLILSGWTYIYYYLGNFGISVEDASIDYTQFAIYSFAVLTYYASHCPVIFWLVIVLFICILYFLSNQYHKMNKMHLNFWLLVIL